MTAAEAIADALEQARADQANRTRTVRSQLAIWYAIVLVLMVGLIAAGWWAAGQRGVAITAALVAVLLAGVALRARAISRGLL